MHKVPSIISGGFLLLSVLEADCAATFVVETHGQNPSALGLLEATETPLETQALSDHQRPLSAMDHKRVEKERRPRGPRFLFGRVILPLSALMLLAVLAQRKLKSKTRLDELKSFDEQKFEEGVRAR